MASGWTFYATPGNNWEFWTGDGVTGAWTPLSGGPVALGQWTYVVGTYDAGSATMRLYVDGTLSDTQTNVTYAPQAFNELWVGSGANEVAFGDFFWVGGVDEVAIYDRALTLGEVQDHFVASFGIGTAPVIAFDPQDVLVVFGEPATMNVGARGLPLLTYQWQLGGVDVPGANDAALEIASAGASDAGLYSCVVTNPYGAVTSGVGELDVLLIDNGISFSTKEEHADQNLASDEVAGFFPLAFWNNMPGQGSQPLAGVLDKNGDAVPGLDVRWSLSNTWGDGSAGLATPDAKVARGYFDDGDNPGEAAGDGGVNGDGIGVSVTVSNVPFAEYTVVLYRSSDQGPAGTYVPYTVNGVTNGDRCALDPLRDPGRLGNRHERGGLRGAEREHVDHPRGSAQRHRTGQPVRLPDHRPGSTHADRHLRCGSVRDQLQPELEQRLGCGLRGGVGERPAKRRAVEPGGRRDRRDQRHDVLYRHGQRRRQQLPGGQALTKGKANPSIT